MSALTKERAPALTEKDWMALVIELARTLGWKCYHPWLSIRSERGFPDLTLVRERVVFAELKTDKGKTTPKQDEWLRALRDAGAEAYLWRPVDWDRIVLTLNRHAWEEQR